MSGTVVKIEVEDFDDVNEIVEDPDAELKKHFADCKMKDFMIQHCDREIKQEPSEWSGSDSECCRHPQPKIKPKRLADITFTESESEDEETSRKVRELRFAVRQLEREKDFLITQAAIDNEKASVAIIESTIKDSLRKVEAEKFSSHVNALNDKIDELREEIRHSANRQSLLHAQKCEFQIENESLKQKVHVIAREKMKLEQKVKFLTTKLEKAGVQVEEIIMPQSPGSESEFISVG